MHVQGCLLNLSCRIRAERSSKLAGPGALPASPLQQNVTPTETVLPHTLGPWGGVGGGGGCGRRDYLT